MEEKDETMAEEEKKAEEPAEPMDIDVETLDAFVVEDVTDIGNAQPLFSNFTSEDWMLLSLRFECHLLCHAFRHDLNDSDRPSFIASHLGFYYHKYFKKQCDLKAYGLTETTELIELVQDTVELTASSIFETQLSEDTPLDNFVRLTEDARRDRQLRIDSGDESAKLKFQRQQAGQEPQAWPQQQGKGAVSRAPAQQQPPRGPYGGNPAYGAGAQKRPAPAESPYMPSKAARPAPAYGGAYGSGGAPRPYGGPGYGGGAAGGAGGAGYGGSAYSRR